MNRIFITLLFTFVTTSHILPQCMYEDSDDECTIFPLLRAFKCMYVENDDDCPQQQSTVTIANSQGQALSVELPDDTWKKILGYIVPDSFDYSFSDDDFKRLDHFVNALDDKVFDIETWVVLSRTSKQLNALTAQKINPMNQLVRALRTRLKKRNTSLSSLKNMHEETALHLAAHSRLEGVFILLLKTAGKNSMWDLLSQKGNYGSTPLEFVRSVETGFFATFSQAVKNRQDDVITKFLGNEISD